MKKSEVIEMLMVPMVIFLCVMAIGGAVGVMEIIAHFWRVWFPEW
jgi:hypothetical protein